MSGQAPGQPGGLFGAVVSDATTDRLLDDQAFLSAMLEFEAALALASAEHGLVPVEAAEAIVSACDPSGFDIAEIGAQARDSGSPVIPLVRMLTAAVGPTGAAWVHRGATTQDVVDTAGVLLSRRVGDDILLGVREACDHAALLAQQHSDTVIAARTLGQHAEPTTFGLKAAGWLTGLWEAHDGLERVLRTRLAVQLGGASGTLAGFDGRGLEMIGALAQRLGLAEPLLPWHTNRTRAAELAAALAVVSGVWGKIAADLSVLTQTDVAEVTVAAAAGAGSSAMPHKENPVDVVALRAASVRVPGLVSTLLLAMHQENERAIGTWQAEWPTLREVLRLACATTRRGAAMLGGLVVDPVKMRFNLDAGLGLTMSSRLADRLSDGLGRTVAHDLVAELCSIARTERRQLVDVVREDPRVAHLSADEVEALADPTTYLGSAGALIDRAVADHRRRRSAAPGE